MKAFTVPRFTQMAISVRVALFGVNDRMFRAMLGHNAAGNRLALRGYILPRSRMVVR